LFTCVSQPAGPNETESEPKVRAGRTIVVPSGITAIPRLNPTTGCFGADHAEPLVVVSTGKVNEAFPG